MSYWIITVAIVAIALCVIAIVAIGMHGSLSRKAPEFAILMANTARHLNGEAPPPPGLVNFFEDLRIRSGSSGVENTGEQPKVS